MPTLYSYYRRSGGNTPDGTGDERFELDYNYSTDYANNCDNFTMSLYMRTAYWDSAQISVNGRTILDGVTQSFSKTILGSGSNRYLIGTRTQTVYHNADGSKQCYIQGQGSELGHGYLGTENRLLTLPQIPRYANITSFTTDSVTMNSFHFNVTADASIDYVQHSLNGGAWTDSGNQTITGREPGTTYSLRCRVRRTDSGLWTESGTISVTTVDKNRVTSSIVNTNCDTALTVTASNASGSQCDIYIELLNATKTARIGDAIRHTNTTNTTFTVEEIQSLANLIPNDNSANFRINAVTVVGGADAYTDYKDGTYSIVNANPAFSNFTYEDTNATTIALTNPNKQTIIKGYSNLRAIISTANKATAVKGATMAKYRLVVGSKQIDVDYNASATVNLDLTAIDNNVFTVYAIDSRGNSTAKQISPSTYLDYTKLSIAQANGERGDGGVSDDVTLIANGAFWNSSFGAVSNTLQSITYKYKKTTDTPYVDGTTTITPTILSNSFNIESLIAGDLEALGFDAGYSYNIILTVADKLSSASYPFVVGTGTPSYAAHKDGMAINMPFDETKGKSFQVAGKIYQNGADLLDSLFPIGRGFIDTTDTDYSNYLGFTWQKFSIGRTPVGKDTTQTEFNTIGKIGGSKDLQSHNHTENGAGGHNHTYWVAPKWQTYRGTSVSAAFSDDPNVGLSFGGTTSWAGDHSHTINNAGTGNSGNLQPYEVVNYWKRIA